MKQGITMNELAAEVHRQDQSKKDYIVSSDSIYLQATTSGITMRVVQSGTPQREFFLNNTAHNQLASYLDIPRAYYDKMLCEQPDLLTENVNRWLQCNPPKQRMLRTLDGTARAFLSDRYRRIDNAPLKELGYDVEGYDLPNITIHQIIVDGDQPIEEALSLTERREARRESLPLRCETAANLVNNSNEIWLCWCDLNDEADCLNQMINGSVNVQGSDTPDYKSNSMLDFAAGKIKCLITKPKIAGYGMNWQNCHNMIFVGISDSFEAYYQAVRRCWRFGQAQDVNVYIIISAKEGSVKQNIERKEYDNEVMRKHLIDLTKDITKRELQATCRISTEYATQSTGAYLYV